MCRGTIPSSIGKRCIGCSVAGLRTAVSEPSRMKGCSLLSPPMARGRRRRSSSVPARGRPSSRSLLASRPSMALENRSSPPDTGAATAPTRPLPTPLTKPAGRCTAGVDCSAGVVGVASLAYSVQIHGQRPPRGTRLSKQASRQAQLRTEGAAGLRALQRLGHEAGDAAVEAHAQRLAALRQALPHAADVALLSLPDALLCKAARSTEEMVGFAACFD